MAEDYKKLRKLGESLIKQGEDLIGMCPEDAEEDGEEEPEEETETKAPAKKKGGVNLMVAFLKKGKK